LKQLIPFNYLRDLERLRQNASTAALLTWAAIPPTTSGTSPYWDHVDPRKRRAIAGSTTTLARLAPTLASCRKRLLDAGQTKHAAFFEPGEAVDFQRAALSGTGEQLLSHLLTFESQVVHQAAETLTDIHDFLADEATAPSRAVERLAEMGADITEAFHGELSTVYGGDTVRSLGSAVFLEASCALDPALRTTRPNALLRLIVLKQPHSYAIADYLKGIAPPPDQIAVAQTLASIT
jgi:hypothetical protein